MTSAIEEYYKLKRQLEVEEEPRKGDNVDFESFKIYLKADRERLEKRKCVLLAELESLDIKIAGLNYVEDEILMIMEQQ